MLDVQTLPQPLVLDIGGEGRHPTAWNINPSAVRTVGPDRGLPIPRHILGRADCIPLPHGCAVEVIVERTPLTEAALRELRRVVQPAGVIILRHAQPHGIDPHALAKQVLGPPRLSQRIEIGGRPLQESIFDAPRANPVKIGPLPTDAIV